MKEILVALLPFLAAYCCFVGIMPSEGRGMTFNMRLVLIMIGSVSLGTWTMLK